MVKATLSSALPEGTELSLILNGLIARDVAVNGKGKATARWTDVTPGEREVCIDQCQDICNSARCGE